MDLYKIWSSEDCMVHGESCMFAGARQASLLFPIKRILRVVQPQENRVYREGVDYQWTYGTCRMTLTDHSAIPFLTAEDLSPSGENAILYPEPGNNAITDGPNHTLLRFDNADFFARHQVEVDYEAQAIDFPDVLQTQLHKLPRIREKLSAGKPVEIVHLGDSISDGYNATGFVGIPPFCPTWAEQFVQHLRGKYHSRIQYRNYAITGSCSLSALDNRALWMERKADLLIFAYGMNDLWLGKDVFLQAHRLLIALAKKYNPQAEILLVATMAANPLWNHIKPEEQQSQHNGFMALSSEYGDELAVANVYDVWQECVRRKGYYSLTGNGVNHSNDFGHRLYMGVLEKIFP